MDSEIQLIKNILFVLLNYTPGHDYIVNRADKSSIDITIQNPVLNKQYGKRLTYRGDVISLIMPFFIFDRSIIQLYASLSSKISSIELLRPIIYVYDCDASTLSNIRLYNMLRSMFNLNVDKSTEISIIVNKLLTASKKAKEYRSKELSDEEYIEYQHVMDEINRCIRTLERSLPYSKLLEVIDAAMEIIENQEIKPEELGKVISEITGLYVVDSDLHRISEVLGECPRDISETYARLIKRVKGKFIILIPEYLGYIIGMDVTLLPCVVIRQHHE
ncbi:MAG: hypothetical protein QXU22_00435 [Desulfurococcaceae archaeon]